MSRHHTATLIALTGIFLMAAAVRIYNIDDPALWTDEGFTYYTFKIDLFEAIKGDRHPPFYFYSLHAWVGVAGDSVLAMRWWSMLPGMLTIAVAYQLGRELVHYRPLLDGKSGVLGVPVLAALMLALTDGENYLAQELRMYTWHVFSAAWSTWFYLRYIRQPARLNTLGWFAANLLLLHTHYFGIFVLATQGIYTLLVLRRRVLMGALGVFVMSGVFFLPWFVLVTLAQFAEEAVCVNCAPPDNWAILLDFREKWFGQQWPLMLALFVLGIVTPHPFIKRGFSERVKSSLLLLGLLIAPLAGTYTLGHDEVIFWAHRLVQISIPIALFFALGLGYLERMARAVVVVALIAYGLTTVDWYRIKVPWDVMAGSIATYAESEELALAEVDYEESALLYYYDHQLPADMQISTFPMWSGDDPSSYYELFLPELLQAQRTLQADSVKTAWVTHFSKSDWLLRKLSEGGYQRTMTLAHEHLDSVVNVYRYDLLPDEPLATFESGMILRAAEFDADRFTVELWWEAAHLLDVDYTVSVFVLDDAGRMIAQMDSPPFFGERPTSAWPLQTVIYDPHPLQMIDAPTAPADDAIADYTIADYTINVKVYSWRGDGVSDVASITGDFWVEIGSLKPNVLPSP